MIKYFVFFFFFNFTFSMDAYDNVVGFIYFELNFLDNATSDSVSSKMRSKKGIPAILNILNKREELDINLEVTVKKNAGYEVIFMKYDEENTICKMLSRIGINNMDDFCNFKKEINCSFINNLIDNALSKLDDKSKKNKK